METIFCDIQTLYDLVAMGNSATLANILRSFQQNSDDGHPISIYEVIDTERHQLFLLESRVDLDAWIDDHYPDIL